MATTTPNYGWDVPTSTDYVKDGATAIETLGDDIDATLWTALGGAYPGLRLIKKQTIGTGVSSVSVTNAFSATYDNYRILVSGGTGSSATADIRFQLTGITSGYYGNLMYSPYASNANPSSVGTNNAASLPYCGVANIYSLNAQIEINNPFLTEQKMISATFFDTINAGRSQGLCDALTSVTGFTLITGSGAFTGGTIYVYGYGAS